MSRGQEGCKNSLQKGDRFSVRLFTRVGAKDAACGFGFGWAAGLVSVTVWLRFLLRVALVAVTACYWDKSLNTTKVVTQTSRVQSF